MYAVMSASYALMAGDNHYFQYLWILQFGSGVALLLTGVQFLKLFPNRVGLLLGLGTILVIHNEPT